MKSAFRLNNFDLLRLLAATQVVLTHSVTHLDIARPYGWSVVDAFPGVPIFFVMSGFLISASYERAPGLRTYARNRVLRIVPGLWCVVLLTVPVAASFGVAMFQPKAAAWFVAQLGGLIFTPGFMSDFGFGSYNGALWTIPIELQFYFLLPLLYLLTSRRPERRTAWLAVITSLFVVVALVYASTSSPLAENTVESAPHKLLRYSFIPHFSLFLLGVLLQRVQAHTSRFIAGKGIYWLAGYLAVYFVLPRDTAAHYVLTTSLLGVVAVALAYTAPGFAERAIRGNDISYGVYIYHGLVLNVFVELELLNDLWLVPIVVAITAVLAALSWYLLERPLLRRKRPAVAPTSIERQPHPYGSSTMTA